MISMISPDMTLLSHRAVMKAKKPKLKIEKKEEDWYDRFLLETFESVENLQDIVQFAGDGFYIPASAIKAFLDERIPLKFIIAVKILNCRGWHYLCRKGKADEAYKELCRLLKISPTKLDKMLKKYEKMMCVVED